MKQQKKISGKQPKLTPKGPRKWNHIIRPDVMRSADRAPVRGQGLGFTM